MLEMKNKGPGQREKRELKSLQQLRTKEKETGRSPENMSKSLLQGFHSLSLVLPTYPPV